MLAPRVINFPLPKSYKKDMNGIKDICKTMDQFNFPHSVTMLLPDTLNPPNTVLDILSNDTTYYHVKNVPAHELIDPKFLDWFIINGNLTLSSVGTRLDLDNCMSINSKGILQFLLKSDTYYSLGLEGMKSTVHKDRFLLSFDLKSKKFSLSSKQHLRIASRLAACPDLKFDIILAWEPLIENVCPSSIAAWFNEASYKVNSCTTNFQRTTHFNIDVPVFDKTQLDEINEWVGMVHLGCDLTSTHSAISSYHAPEPNVSVGQVVALQWTGLFPPSLITKAFENLRQWNSNRGSSQWCSMSIHGLDDSITILNNKQHDYINAGDYNLNIFMSPDGKCDALLHVSSWKKNEK